MVSGGEMACGRLYAALIAPTTQKLDEPQRKSPARVTVNHLRAIDGTMASQDVIKNRRNNQQKCSLFL